MTTLRARNLRHYISHFATRSIGIALAVCWLLGCGTEPTTQPLDHEPPEAAAAAGPVRWVALLAEYDSLDAVRRGLRAEGFALEMVGPSGAAVLRAECEGVSPPRRWVLAAELARSFGPAEWSVWGPQVANDAERMARSARASSGDGGDASAEAGPLDLPLGEENAGDFEHPPEWPDDLSVAPLPVGAFQLTGAASGATAQLTTLYAAGSVAVGVVLPESDGSQEPSTEDWTAEERDQAIMNVQTALLSLAAAEPNAELTFVIHLENRPAPGGLLGTVRVPVEAIRRIQVNKGFNFPATLMNPLSDALAPAGGWPAGSWLVAFRAYADRLRQEYNTNWAFSVVVVDNSNAKGGRASAFIFGPVTTLFASNGWRVFRHEMGHIFGARDEYHPDAKQSPSALAGALGAPNANSQYDDGTGFVLGAGESVPSLMINNVEPISVHARHQLGWMDQDGDGVLDLFDQAPRVIVQSHDCPQGACLDATMAVSPYIPGESYLKVATSLDAIRRAWWRLEPAGGEMGPWVPIESPAQGFQKGIEKAQVHLPVLPPGTYGARVRAETWTGQVGEGALASPVAVYPGQGPSTALLAAVYAPSWAVIGSSIALEAQIVTLGISDGAPLQVRWDFGDDGIFDTVWSASPTAQVPSAWSQTWTQIAGEGPAVMVVQVRQGSAEAEAKAVVQLREAPPPPNAAFTARGDVFVGAGENLAVTLTPISGPVNTLNDTPSLAPPDAPLPEEGRWDLDGDGIFDTDWAPLAPLSAVRTLPSLRIDMVGTTGIPGGVAFKAVWGDTIRALFVDGQRGVLAHVRLTEPTSPQIIQTLDIDGLSAWSEICEIPGGWLVSTANGVARLALDEDGMLQVQGVHPGGEGPARGLSCEANIGWVAQGLGVAALQLSSGETLAWAPHALDSPAVDVSVLPEETRGCAVSGGGPLVGGKLVAFSTALAPPENSLIVSQTLPLAAVDTLGAPLPSNPTAVLALAGGLCAVADRTSGFHVVKAWPNEPPLLLARVSTDGTVWDVARGPNNHLWVGSVNMLHVYDLTDPTSPRATTDLARRFVRGFHFDAAGRLHLAASTSGYQLAEVVNAPFRSATFRFGLQVRAGNQTSQAWRTVTATAYGHPPVAALQATVESWGVALDATGSFDPDENEPWDALIRARWDLDGDGIWDTAFEPKLTAQLSPPAGGAGRARVQIRDRFWATDVAEIDFCWSPVPERCGDGVDNDCNGMTDESAVELGGPCALAAGCGGSGIWLCRPDTLEVVCGTGLGALSAELCGDSIDNDCDGLTDEGFDWLGSACSAGLGDCEGVGEWICPEGGAAALVCTSVALAPIPEICDGLDNDCDGDVDEEIAALLLPCDGPDPDNCATGTFSCVDGVPSCDETPGKVLPEVCDGQDNNCNGLTDEIFVLKGQECDGPDADKCRNGQFVCRPDGKSVICVEEGPPEGIVELCNGIDDDCDGQTDEGYPTPGTACDGPDADACKDGVWACAPDATTAECNEPKDSGSVEVCNSIDDDCDGMIDEGFPAAGGPCDGADPDQCESGIWACNPEGEAVCIEAGPPDEGPWGNVEICNYVDDDCDGAVDEDFPEVGTACDGPDSDQCNNGWWGCAADSSGVVCFESGPSLAELCNGLDDDCDGTTDESFPVGLPCDGPDTDFCKNGQFVCALSGLTVVCGPENPAHIQEQCNGQDDDCDGQTDESFQGMGKVCELSGPSTCAGGYLKCEAGKVICAAPASCL